MEEGLKIRIGADVVEVKKSLSELQSQLKRFQTSLESASDPRSIERLNKAILRTNQYIKGVKTAGLADVPAQANSASVSLVNLGRVASDLPFGFIAIANNLDPLFQSFGQLRKETGSTGAALKSLGASLLGGGGLAFGFSVLTAAITYFSLQSQKAKKETKELKDEIKSVADVRGEAEASVQGEIARVQALASVVRDESKAKQERNRALKELKEINKGYFGDLTLEGNKLGTLTGKVEEYTKAIVQAAIVKGFENEISKVATALFQEEKALEGVAKKYKQVETAAKSAALASAPSATNFSGSNFGGTGQLMDLRSSTNELTDQVKKVTELRLRFNDLKNGIQDATAASLKFDPIKTDTGRAKKEVDLLKEQIEALQRLKSEVGLLKSEEFQLLDLQIQLELRDQNKNKLDGEQLRRVIDKLILDADLEAKPVSIPVTFNPARNAIQGNGFDGINKTAELLKKQGEAAGAAINASLNTERLTQVAEAVNGVVTPAFVGLFDTLVSGSGSALQAVGQFLKEIIKRLAAAVIQAAAFAGIMSAFGLGGGASFGQLFSKNLLGGFGIKGAAAPGNAVGRGLALNAAPVVLETRIAGNDLYLVQNRTQSSINRRG